MPRVPPQSQPVGRNATIRPQICQYDRYTPSESSYAKHVKSKPSTTQRLHATLARRVEADGVIMLEWTVNNESGIIFLRVADKYLEHVRSTIDASIAELMLGGGKGAGKEGIDKKGRKGHGKGYKSKLQQADDHHAFDEFDGDLRRHLNDLTTPMLPFTVELRKSNADSGTHPTAAATTTARTTSTDAITKSARSASAASAAVTAPVTTAAATTTAHASLATFPCRDDTNP
eukprot:6285759-Amphidinium_carterae.1